MPNYEDAKVKQTNTLLNKLKSVAKHKHVTSCMFLFYFSWPFLKKVLWDEKNSSNLPPTRHHMKKMIKFPQ